MTKRPLQTLGDVLRRDYKRRWRAKNRDKTREYYARAIVRQLAREARAQP